MAPKSKKQKHAVDPKSTAKNKNIEPTEDLILRDGVLVTKPKCWETFFYCQKSPVLRSQMLTSLMAGKQLEAARVPTSALLDAVLIANTCRVYHEAEVVDSYEELVARIKDEWNKPDWSAKVFSQLHANAASFLVHHGTTEYSCAEEQYLIPFTAWYLSHDPPVYFEREVSEADLDAQMPGAKPVKGRKAA